MTEEQLIRDILKHMKSCEKRAINSVSTFYGNIDNLIVVTEQELINNCDYVGRISAVKICNDIINLNDNEILIQGDPWKNNLERWLSYKIKNLFLNFLKDKRDKISSISLDDLMPNPYMIFLLKNSNGLDNVNDLVDFLLAQYIERSMVTSFGSLIEAIAGVFCDMDFKKGRRGNKHLDKVKTSGNTIYGISIKSGPNTINDPDVSDISDALNDWKAKKMAGLPPGISSVETVLGLTYGNNPSLQSFKVGSLGHTLVYGRKFWEFVSEGLVEHPENTYIMVKEAAEYAVTEFGFNAIRDAIGLASIRVKSEFVDKYCDEYGKIQWDQLLEDNM